MAVFERRSSLPTSESIAHELGAGTTTYPPPVVPVFGGDVSNEVEKQLRVTGLGKSSLLEHFLANEPGKESQEDANNTCCVIPTLISGEEKHYTREEVHQMERQKKQQEERDREANVSDLCISMSDPEAGWLWKRWRLGKFMESPKIKSFFIFLVCLNGVFIGAQADNDPESVFWLYSELIFVTFFSVEIILKIIAFNAMYWTDVWNLIDFTIISISVFEIIMSLAIGYTTTGISAFRLIRILRVIRVVNFVERLNIIVEAFVRSMASVAWVGVLLIMVIYMFAILGQSLFGNSSEIIAQYPVAAAQFATIPQSMVTLLQIMTFDAWASDIANGICDIYPQAWLYFILFIILVALGLLNLLTGIFLKALMDLTDENANKQQKTKLKAKRKLLKMVGTLFKQFDEDDGGTLDDEELPKLLKECRDFQDALDVVGLPYETLAHACEVADYDHVHRLYDPEEDVHYHVEHRPPPEHINPDDLWRDSSCWEGENCHPLPEGVMEEELLECLLQMDDPVVKADHYGLLKKVRFMDRRMQRIEHDVTQVLCILKGETPPTEDPRIRRKTSGLRRRPSTGSKSSDAGSDHKAPNSLIAMMAAPADLKLWDDEFETTVRTSFERYDFDNSGTINSQEELSQLSLNLVYKLGIKPPITDGGSGEWSTWAQDTIKNLIEGRGMKVDEENPLTVEEYMPLFRSAFYGE